MKKLLATLLLFPTLASAGWKCADNACQSASWAHDGVTESRLVSSLPAATVVEPYAATPAEIAAELSASKADAIIRIKQFHADLIDQLTGRETPIEIATWQGQVEMAEEVLNGVPYSFPTVAFFNGRGETTLAGQQAFAQLVKAKSQAYWFVIGLAGKVKKDALTCVASAPDDATVANCLVTAKTAATTALSQAMQALSAIPK